MMNQFSSPGQSILNGQKVRFERERGVWAVHVTRHLAHALITFEPGAERSESVRMVLKALADAGIPIFLVKLHRTAVTFALAHHYVQQADEVLKQAGFGVRIRPDLALVVVIATTMREVSGIMVHISDALYHADAQLYETGDSHDSVQCLIDGVHVESALERLCQEFGLEKSVVHERPLPGNREAQA